VRQHKTYKVVHEEEIEVPPVQPRKAEDGARDNEKKQVWRQDASDTTPVKVTKVLCKWLGLFVDEDPGNQKPGKNKKQIDACPQEWNVKGVMQKNRGHSYCADSVQ
jgi:hypothetical protein